MIYQYCLQSAKIKKKIFLMKIYEIVTSLYNFCGAAGIALKLNNYSDGFNKCLAPLTPGLTLFLTTQNTLYKIRHTNSYAVGIMRPISPKYPESGPLKNRMLMNREPSRGPHRALQSPLSTANNCNHFNSITVINLHP